MFWQHFIALFAALASLATFISVLWNFQDKILSDWIKLGVISGIFLLCFIYAAIQCRSKKGICLKFNDKFLLTIQEANLFNQKGVIVIPVNEYFDTIVDENIISSKSIHGKFIQKYWRDRLPELDEKIDRELKYLSPINTEPSRNTSRKDKYKLGECITIRDGENSYVLVAFTHFDKNNRANIERKEFLDVINKLFSFLSKHCSSQPIHIPLLGTKLSRMGMSPQRILNFMIDAIDFNHSDFSFIEGVFIDIRALKGKVNLNRTENLFSYLKS